jgi:hypothetical protein
LNYDWFLVSIVAGLLYFDSALLWLLNEKKYVTHDLAHFSIKKPAKVAMGHRLSLQQNDATRLALFSNSSVQYTYQ